MYKVCLLVLRRMEDRGLLTMKVERRKQTESSTRLLVKTDGECRYRVSLDGRRFVKGYEGRERRLRVVLMVDGGFVMKTIDGEGERKRGGFVVVVKRFTRQARWRVCFVVVEFIDVMCRVKKGFFLKVKRNGEGEGLWLVCGRG